MQYRIPYIMHYEYAVRMAENRCDKLHTTHYNNGRNCKCEHSEIRSLEVSTWPGRCTLIGLTPLIGETTHVT